MASGERTPRSAATRADLSPQFMADYWSFVEVCLHKVFHQSEHDAHQAVQNMRKRVEELPDNGDLFVYHDSPLQTAAVLAGASLRELSEEELLAYDSLVNGQNPDRPTRDQVLDVYRGAGLRPKAG
ncbi:hypothetical protein [Bradyrhizobium sp. USDA 4451]